MRRMIFLMMLVTTFCCFSQVDVTKFLGIPIDGSKDDKGHDENDRSVEDQF